VPLMRIAIDLAGWQGAFLITGVTIAAVLGPLGLFVIRNAPPARPVVVETETANTTAAAASPQVETTLREALRMPLFWALALGMTFFPFGMVTWITHAAPFYE